MFEVCDVWFGCVDFLDAYDGVLVRQGVEEVLVEGALQIVSCKYDGTRLVLYSLCAEFEVWQLHSPSAALIKLAKRCFPVALGAGSMVSMLVSHARVYPRRSAGTRCLAKYVGA